MELTDITDTDMQTGMKKGTAPAIDEVHVEKVMAAEES